MRHKIFTFWVSVIVCSFVLSMPYSRAAVITVDCNGTSDFNSIQEAVIHASDFDVIEVHPCVYYENISFYGKQITVTSTNPDDVNIVYATVIDGNGAGNVITFNNGETETSILIGLTIENGQTGIYCYKADPSIVKCISRGNTNSGINCDSGASPFVEKCTVRSNDYGIFGSGSASPTILESTVKENNKDGIYNCQGEISDCNIVGNFGWAMSFCNGNINDCNISGNSGGLSNCNGNIRNCTISRNLVGGLMSCNVDVSNCIISANLNDGLGYAGGTITNCTIVGNKGDGVNGTGNPVMKNNIIAQNDGIGCIAGTSNYNNVWQNLGGNYSGLSPGPNDISQNPFFAIGGYWDLNNNWVEGEYHLKSAAGRWEPVSETWVMDDINSPCIDRGDPCSPILFEPNPNGGIINMGAYGGTLEASKSASGIIIPACTQYPAMDHNKDCKVDFADLALFCESWLICNLMPQNACW